MSTLALSARCWNIKVDTAELHLDRALAGAKAYNDWGGGVERFSRVGHTSGALSSGRKQRSQWSNVGKTASLTLRPHRRLSVIKSCYRDFDHDESEHSKVRKDDWRETRARLVAKKYATIRTAADLEKEQKNCPRWAHELGPRVEQGCLLLARPGGVTHCIAGEGNVNTDFSLQVQEHLVILIIKHDWRGSLGLILNRPTNHILGQMTNLMPIFNNNPVHFGGPADPEFCCILHGFPDVEGAEEVCSGLHIGSCEAIKRYIIENDDVTADDFKFYQGTMKWGPGRLEREVMEKLWYSSACNSKLILRKTPHALPIYYWQEIYLLMGGMFRRMADDDGDTPTSTFF
ncbi:hypothetical protein CYMTET_47062 [Cymbomonas tetramitiformis]|uniref:Uncharacterized protein n=1 Tax=Cymbomonas tetramitiformis TaxID=36881 RepID=A0AAE0BW43_9CHLO|nr:hypothetical protein CYMTET_47062 [Cymbomonas tetramitiformis]